MLDKIRCVFVVLYLCMISQCFATLKVVSVGYVLDNESTRTISLSAYNSELKTSIFNGLIEVEAEKYEFESLVLIASVLMNINQVNEIEEILNEAINKSDSTKIKLILINVLMEKGELQSSISLLNSIKVQSITQPVDCYTIGSYYQELKIDDMAYKYFKRGIQICNDATSRLNLIDYPIDLNTQKVEHIESLRVLLNEKLDAMENTDNN